MSTYDPQAFFAAEEATRTNTVASRYAAGEFATTAADHRDGSEYERIEGRRVYKASWMANNRAKLRGEA